MTEYLYKNFDFESILRCTFSLSNSEVKVLFSLMECKSGECVNSVAEKLKRDRSTIQKTILKLLEKDLVEKKKENLEEGGYFFYYFPKSKVELKKQMLASIESWHINVKKEIMKW
jgi:predicted transcriptional regulator